MGALAPKLGCLRPWGTAGALAVTANWGLGCTFWNTADPASASASGQPEAEPAPDSDGDGLADDWEKANGLDPHDPDDAAEDPDGDGLSNLEEGLAGSDPSPWLTPAKLAEPAVGRTGHWIYRHERTPGAERICTLARATDGFIGLVIVLRERVGLVERHVRWLLWRQDRSQDACLDLPWPPDLDPGAEEPVGSAWARWMTGERPETESYTWFDAARRPVRQVILSSTPFPLVLTRSERTWHRDDAAKLRWVRTTTDCYAGRPRGAPDLEVTQIDNGRFWQEVDAGRWDRTSFVWQPTDRTFSLRGYAYGVFGLSAITDFETMRAEPPPDAAVWAVAQREVQWTLVRNQAGQLEALQENRFNGYNQPTAGLIHWFDRDTTGRVARHTRYDSNGERMRETNYDALGRTVRDVVSSGWAWHVETENNGDLVAMWE